MAVYLRKRKTNAGIVYYLDIYHAGRRWYEPTGLRDQADNKVNSKNLLEQAKAQRSRREIELADGETIPKIKAQTDFIAYFQARIDSYPGANPRRLKAVKKHFIDFIKRDRIQFGELNKSLIKDFRMYLETVCKFTTPHNYFATLKAVLNHAVDAGYLLKSPAVGVVNPDPFGKKIRKEVLYDNEIRLLFKTPIQNLEFRRACLFALSTGLGWAEINKLVWSNIDHVNRTLIVIRNKTGEIQSIPLNDTAMTLLGNPAARAAKVFCIKISSTAANKSLGRWVKRAGINKHITFHCLRHAYATSILRNTGDLKLTSDLLGHSTTRHTERYTHLSESAKRDAVNKLPGFAVNDNG